MAVSEAQKRATNKYSKEHFKTLGCKLKKEETEKFQEYAKEQGKTVNDLLKKYVYECIKIKQKY